MLVHARGARGGSAPAGGQQGAPALQPALPEPDRCGSRRLRVRGSQAGDPLQGRGRGGALRRPRAWRGRVRQLPARRLRDRARRWHPALPLHRGRRRRGDGDHARHPRRGPPEQHAEAHRAHPGPRLPRAALRPHPAHPQRGPIEDEQAQVADLDHRLPRGGLPARGVRELHRVPGLVAGHRGGDLQPRRAGEALRAGEGAQGWCGLRPRPPRPPQRRLHPRPDR